MTIINKHFKTIGMMIITLLLGASISMPVMASTLNSQMEETQSYDIKEVKPLNTNSPIVSPKEITCLAQNIYYEAGYESEDGKIAVANVTMNRTKSTLFPRSICGVVYHRAGNCCAFSWVCNNKSTPPNNKAYLVSIQIAKRAISGELKDITYGADHFHEMRVKPKWTYSMVKTAQIGRHIFYSSISAHRTIRRISKDDDGVVIHSHNVV